ncbi:MAG TPA: helix-turn-helix domain-containing protein [Bacteroidales bacterium]|jgi:AraC-like DNA-binding protein|nr:helix-turn-helix domain-containing protein [Bacteroidales bacterium]HNV95870.1 helix-turn-helix domain-containing protein [Bacteroidales bacterium]HOU98918.1 helix-turn-helix domain-containing protein [Bacteroidales bacterium]
MKEQPFHIFHIKNMLCRCCIKQVESILLQNNYTIEYVHLGKISVSSHNFNEKELDKLLTNHGFGIIKDRDFILVEKIKQAVVELIHYSNNVDSIVRKSDYLVERLNMTYQQISKTFSKYNSITLERYILLNKMERVKELVLQNEFTLSEIAYMMDFSSVHHLSSTFKKITGVTVTEFKENPSEYKRSIDELLQ